MLIDQQSIQYDAHYINRQKSGNDAKVLRVGMDWTPESKRQLQFRVWDYGTKERGKTDQSMNEWKSIDWDTIGKNGLSEDNVLVRSMIKQLKQTETTEDTDC